MKITRWGGSSSCELGGNALIGRYELEPLTPPGMKRLEGAASSPMRILFISLIVPLPANNGHKMRTWSTLRALAAEGHEIHFLTFAGDDEIGSQCNELAELCRSVEMVPHAFLSLTSSSDYLGRFLGLFSSQPYATRRFSSPRMRERIRRRLRAGNLDAVVCDTVYAACNLPCTSLPLILNHHNVEHLILERYLPFEPNPAKQLYAWIENWKLKNWERKICRRSAIGMACSGHDQRTLQLLAPRSRVFVVPNVVDANGYVSPKDCCGNSQVILYQGGMDWFPNRDSVEFFVARILPFIRRNIPGIRFVVAGRNPSEAFRRKFASLREVEFTGTVPDMRPVIAGASVCVVPLRIGSGTRLKILEAAAMAKPVVSTSIGAEGLEFRSGDEILLADTPERFANAVVELLKDPERRRALGLAARRRVERDYSLSALRRSLRVALEPLVVPRDSSVREGARR